MRRGGEGVAEGGKGAQLWAEKRLEVVTWVFENKLLHIFVRQDRAGGKWVKESCLAKELQINWFNLQVYSRIVWLVSVCALVCVCVWVCQKKLK